MRPAARRGSRSGWSCLTCLRGGIRGFRTAWLRS